MGQNASPPALRGLELLIEHPKWSTITFEKSDFGPMFDAFLVTKWPIFKAFGTLEGTKWLKLD